MTADIAAALDLLRQRLGPSPSVGVLYALAAVFDATGQIEAAAVVRRWIAQEKREASREGR